jgi:hypothetical protein
VIAEFNAGVGVPESVEVEEAAVIAELKAEVEVEVDSEEQQEGEPVISEL